MRYTAKEISAVFTARRMSVVMAGLLLGAACLVPRGGMAQVSGECVNCHTMHNSQGGTNIMNGTDTVYRSLTRGDCVGCHTATGNAPTGLLDTIPYVNHTTEPALTVGGTLAGGSFYWVGTGTADVKEHNVKGVVAADGVLGNTPPGGTALASQLTCAGTTGCHGDRAQADEYSALSGSHHAAPLTITTGATLATSYRFLNGIKGIEDADWEKTVSATDHNQYYGVGRSTDAIADTHTISALCGQCHGAFHASSAAHNADGVGISYDNTMTSPWVRHPTDFDMNVVKGSEYGAYGGGVIGTGGGAYVPQAPVASGATAVLGTVLNAAGDAVVTCISCHRAHGSNQADLLRWDYTTMDAHAGSSTSGCFACHTTKDT